MVKAVYKANCWENRKTSLVKMGLGGIGIVITGIILLASGRLFWYIAGAAIIAFLWGFINFLSANGWEVEA